ncbi:putative 1-phosphatidylinositol-3-phosphate 5-kinase [Nymphaea thermarum]|nr:putative 1-phosphatidylinositol-3-phosphate 5-kinase [Nymphaea thermarum]
MISPEDSLSSYTSCASSFGELPVDLISRFSLSLGGWSSMEDGEAGSREFSDREFLNASSREHSKDQLDEGRLIWEHSDAGYSSTAIDKLDCVPISRGMERAEDWSDANPSHCQNHNRSFAEDQSVRSEGESDGTESSNRGTYTTLSVNGELDLSRAFDFKSEDEYIWFPPDPEDQEDEIGISVDNDDDDDDNYSASGGKWDESCSLSSLGKNGNSQRIKEERQKVMVEVMNGHFRALVGQLLMSEGIPNGCGGASWLDIVTSLSWEAAILVKPEANEGREMDPGCYVKVKCIASGLPSQSELIKGLVFKKNAAHKRMPSKVQNPKLLLVRGVLGQDANGLSSLNSLKQEKDGLKSVTEMIELCHPNIVLVEKNVSRDVQESLLEKGITLVLDMKLPRLERIARCTGSKIFSSADKNLDIKRCDLFHIEKIVEEHETEGEGGKPPKKTLMFFEGCPRPLGCTILLKGANGNELKKIKKVIQFAVFAAYHLILETSFLVDQRASFPSSRPASSALDSPDTGGGSSTDIDTKTSLQLLENSHTSQGSLHKFPKDGVVPGIDLGLQGISLSDIQASMHEHAMKIEDNNCEESMVEPYIPLILPRQLFSSVSMSIKKVLMEGIPVVSHPSYQSISAYLGLKDKEPDTSVDIGAPFSLSEKVVLPETDGRVEGNEEKLENGTYENEKSESDLIPIDVTSKQNDNAYSDSELSQRHFVKSALDPQSILVLRSSCCISKGTTCERSYLSRIKYYGDFDKSLGRFLRDNLLNQAHSCSICGEAPYSHVYWYTHQNGRLEVRVKQLPQDHQLPGKEEGKLWMWTRCLKCERKNDISKPTNRVVMSAAAHGLSFGKFLELSFANRSVTDRLASCGHSLNRDCLRFYGLGSLVTMFSYSSVEIYGVQMPPPMLDFSNQNGEEWFENKVKHVQEKGNMLFAEVKRLLQEFEVELLDSAKDKFLEFPAPLRGFTDLEQMLEEEMSDFERTLNKTRTSGQTVREMLHLNHLVRELLLEFYIWDQRLKQLSSYCTNKNVEKTEDLNHANPTGEEGSCAGIKPDDGNSSVNGYMPCGSNCVPKHLDGLGLEKVFPHACFQDENGVRDAHNLLTPGDVPVRTLQTESLFVGHDHPILDAPAICRGESCLVEKDSAEPVYCDPRQALVHGEFHDSIDEQQLASHSNGSSVIPLNVEIHEENYVPLPDCSKMDLDILVSEEPLTSISKAMASDTDGMQQKTSINSQLTSSASAPEKLSSIVPSENNLDSDNLDNAQGWVWRPFSESCAAFRKDLRSGYSPKFDFIRHYIPFHLSTTQQLMVEEATRLHFPVGDEDSTVSVYEDELTSIISCALAFLHDKSKSLRSALDEPQKVIDREHVCSDIHNTMSLNDNVVLRSWSSWGSFDASERHSEGNASSEELSTSGFESQSMNPLLYSKDLHPEVILGDGNSATKGKCSVVCVYAEQFYALRKRCCPAELDYISSLSHCRKWDAKGGKSKAFFAKTLDDRFIIKQVQRTEFDSFLKFGPEYFKYISQSLSSRSQTCLAKILGIYQINIRQQKGGKELKMDVMVMENLLFGRNICRKYDLKGALHSRYTSDAKGMEGTEKVLLDQNLIEDMCTSPLFVGRKTKHLLQRAIWNDTAFLTSINVMDYSLLVGVDSEHHELVCGIIDYMRQYTWDKHLETWVKASLVVPRNSLPTVISPKEYKKRFRKAMCTYFVTVPDPWCEEPIAGSCDDGTDDSSY